MGTLPTEAERPWVHGRFLLTGRATAGRRPKSATVDFECQIVGELWGPHVDGVTPLPPRPSMLWPSDDGSAMRIKIDKMQVRHPESRAWLYGFHDDAGVFRIIMFGLDLCNDVAEACRALEGLGPFKNFVKRGTRRGSGFFEDANQFHAAIASAVEALRAKGINPTEKQVAQYFRQSNDVAHPMTGARQLRRWLQLFFPDMTWSQFVQSLG